MSRNRYLVPAAETRFEEEINRSRFLTLLSPAGSIDEATAFLASVREAFPEATHHCWAYLVGPPGTSTRIGMSDDGEPHGTAGRPMLEVLTHSGIGDVAAVVVRWYGGTKLGKGGLARAYSGGVKQALASLPTREKIWYERLALTLPYQDIASFRRCSEAAEVVVVTERFDAAANYELEVPDDRVADFRARLDEETSGRAVWSTAGEKNDKV